MGDESERRNPVEHGAWEERPAAPGTPPEEESWSSSTTDGQPDGRTPSAPPSGSETGGPASAGAGSAARPASTSWAGSAGEHDTPTVPLRPTAEPGAERPAWPPRPRSGGTGGPSPWGTSSHDTGWAGAAPAAPPVGPPPSYPSPGSGYGGGYGGGGWPPAGGYPAYPGGYPGSQPSKKRRSRAGVIGLALLLALAAGGIGGGIATALQSSSSTSSSQTSLKIASAPVSTTTSLNVSAVAAKIEPAVVDITSVLGLEGAEAAGTGMILTPNGEVLTNNHVIEDATSITVVRPTTGQRYKARVLGVDPTKDVALIKLEGAHNLPTVTLGNSNDVKLGQPVVAIGNALDLKGTPTVTSGVISNLNRSITAEDPLGNTEHLTGLFQTDAPISPGNSGGPLCNAAGQVIGIDTAAATGTSSQPANDIGFAIPIDHAIPIIKQIQAGKSGNGVEVGTHGLIGVEVTTVAEAESPTFGLGGFGYPQQIPVSKGAYVARVIPGSPAANAGIRAGDVIIGFDGKTVTSPSELGKLVEKLSPGTSVTVKWVGPFDTVHSAHLKLMAAPPA
jgi:S1-C subfamily serine protease